MATLHDEVFAIAKEYLQKEFHFDTNNLINYGENFIRNNGPVSNQKPHTDYKTHYMPSSMT